MHFFTSMHRYQNYLMMTPQLLLTIPTPCHENWDAMTPELQGRYCGQCSKTVVDFSLMTDGQILDVLKKQTGGTCGRFTTQQLFRPLLAPAKPKWYTKGIWKYIISATLLGKTVSTNAQKVQDTTINCTKNATKQKKIVSISDLSLNGKKALTPNIIKPEPSSFRIGHVSSFKPSELSYVLLDEAGNLIENVVVSHGGEGFVIKNKCGQIVLFFTIEDIDDIKIKKPSTIQFKLKQPLPITIKNCMQFKNI